MEGQPRVPYEWRGGARGVGVHSRRAAAVRQASGQVSRRADTSGADLRVFEPSGYTASSTVVVSYRRATRVTVVSVALSSSSLS